MQNSDCKALPDLIFKCCFAGKTSALHMQATVAGAPDTILSTADFTAAAFRLGIGAGEFGGARVATCDGSHLTLAQDIALHRLSDRQFALRLLTRASNNSLDCKKSLLYSSAGSCGCCAVSLVVCLLVQAVLRETCLLMLKAAAWRRTYPVAVDLLA